MFRRRVIKFQILKISAKFKTGFARPGHICTYLHVLIDFINDDYFLLAIAMNLGV